MSDLMLSLHRATFGPTTSIGIDIPPETDTDHEEEGKTLGVVLRRSLPTGTYHGLLAYLLETDRDRITDSLIEINARQQPRTLVDEGVGYAVGEPVTEEA